MENKKSYLAKKIYLSSCDLPNCKNIASYTIDGIYICERHFQILKKDNDVKVVKTVEFYNPVPNYYEVLGEVLFKTKSYTNPKDGKFSWRRWKGHPKNPFSKENAIGNYAFLLSEDAPEQFIIESEKCKISDYKGGIKGWVEIRKVKFTNVNNEEEIWEFYVQDGKILKQTKLSPRKIDKK